MEYQEVENTLPPLNSSWHMRLESEFKKPYFKGLKQFIAKEAKSGKIIYPKADEVFAALNHTDFENVKVVILGQDPYHGENQAHGLAFSVRRGCKIPPSLRNMYKELASDLNFDIPEHGNLSTWADQGVLLLNAALTVEAKLAASHRGKGWEQFTDTVIKQVDENQDHVVFILWGSHAIQKKSLINEQKHMVLTAPHPSPLSAYRGFFGCKHFSQANDVLKQWGKEPINWQL